MALTTTQGKITKHYVSSDGRTHLPSTPDSNPKSDQLSVTTNLQKIQKQDHAKHHQKGRWQHPYYRELQDKQSGSSPNSLQGEKNETNTKFPVRNRPNVKMV